MSAKKPTIVVVPGAWSTPAHYRKLVEALQARSFEVKVPSLATNNGARPPNSSFQDDVAAVRALVEPIVEQGNEVVIVMHSYGGAVGTDATEGLSRKEREANNLPGGVVHLVYLCAYLLAKGQSVWNVIQKSGMEQDVAPHLTIHEDGVWTLNDPGWAMYHDLSPDDQEEQKTLVVPHNSKCIYEGPSYECWRNSPLTYIRTTEDRCVPPPYQDICVANAKDAAVPVDIKVMDCAHSLYAKYPEEIVDIVIGITN
uniref:AB hydrolase-1 domain-containing protein n=1 Tax=Bionectria ochroleuca TaxID=29856 RepID=A0A8H7MY24_BIOOC